jgi:predicted Zn-dependent peptidase
VASRSTGAPRRAGRSNLPAAEQRVGSTRTLLTEAQGGLVRRTVLPGGLRIVTEAMPTVRSAAFGIWVGTGSRDETPTQAGASHYLEHLLFKGTPTRSALDISAAIESRGGDMNAFTAKEFTCYYARVLDADLPIAVDVVSDMVTASLITKGDVDSERGVILEEIAMRDDDPTDLVHDEFAQRLFGDTRLGRPILGTVESINALNRRTIHGYWSRRYRPENIVVAVAGNVDHATVVRAVKKAFGAAGLLEDTGVVPDGPRTGRTQRVSPGGIRLVQRETEQANLVLGVPGLARDDDRRFALGVLNATIGGGMSARLFQEVREKRGLAYSVYSYASHFADTGTWGVYAGCLPHKVDEVLELCRTELDRVRREGITAEELERGKGQMRGGLVLGLEDTGSRMSRIGKAELTQGYVPAVDELLGDIDAVTLDDVAAVAEAVLSAPPTLAVIGPFDSESRFASAVA